MCAELFDQGIRNIQDACFVRDHFVSAAFVHGYWNLVIAESQRAVELVVRGLQCLVGRIPGRHHDISGHVKALMNELSQPESKNVLPFVKGVYMPDGYRIGMRFREESVELLEYYDGTYRMCGVASIGWRLFETQLASILFEVDMHGVKLFHEDRLMLVYSFPKTEPSRLAITGKFNISPGIDRLRYLRNAGERLSKIRTRAIYSEELYDRDKALEAIDNMNVAIDASKMLLDFE